MTQFIDLVNQGKFTELFVEELGWSRSDGLDISAEIEGENYDLKQVARYRGIRVWVHLGLPSQRIQRLLDRIVKSHADERLVIYTDGVHQHWRWPQTGDRQGRGQARLVTHQHFVGNTNEALEQRLSMIEIGLNEAPTVIEVLRRLRSAFDADRVTRAFYRAYVSEHVALQRAVLGIDEDDDREWYSTLLLNRLMFIYFMQRKGFMDGDRDYLANRLRKVQDAKGKDKFHGFFRNFLLPLFHRGLGSNDGTKELDELTRTIVGDVPFVNGGIFSVHELEARFDNLDVPDSAFTRIFAFFDSYQWHLEDKPTGADNEINPDVLGYIFEQFINYEESGKKENGAYYTREDVTGYMSVSTVTTRFLDRLESATGVTCFHLLREEPHRYIPESLGFAAEAPLPEIRDWRAKASTDFGLPGENWYEVRARRDRYKQVLGRLKSGEVKAVADLITFDLNIEELALDTIALTTDPNQIASAWEQLKAITVLDPTCGSGAFLFSALERLQVLYSAVLDAAESTLATNHHAGLEALVTEASRHANRAYFVLKLASQHNIFGVDLMRGAAEIARLRLYLKLIAQLETRQQIEPLPDLEFNIKTGNLLIGATTPESLMAMGDTLDTMTEAEQLTREAAAMAELGAAYVAAQESGNDKVIHIAKKALRRTEANLRERLDRFVHLRLGGTDFHMWREQCQPFHWFAEFSDVFNRGGFDVVIGNPPYIAKSKVDYPTSGHRTSTCPDIYAICIERAISVLSAQGRFAMIVMSSLCFNSDFSSVRALLRERLPTRWVSSYSRIPAGLFTGARVRNSIVIGHADVERRLLATGLHRWEEAYRPHLLQLLNYHVVPESRDTKDGRPWPFVPHAQIAEALWSVAATVDTGLPRNPKGLDLYQTNSRGGATGSGPYMLGFRTNGYNWLPVFIDIPPAEDAEGNWTKQTKIAALWFRKESERDLALSLLSSRWAFVWWAMVGDDFDVTGGGLLATPLPRVDDEAALSAVHALVDELRVATTRNVTWKRNAGKRIGNWHMPKVRDVTEKLDAFWGEYFLPDSPVEERMRLLAEAYYFTVRTDLSSLEAAGEELLAE